MRDVDVALGPLAQGDAPRTLWTRFKEFFGVISWDEALAEWKK